MLNDKGYVQHYIFTCVLLTSERVSFTCAINIKVTTWFPIPWVNVNVQSDSGSFKCEKSSSSSCCSSSFPL